MSEENDPDLENEEWLKELQRAADDYANKLLPEEQQKNPLLPDHALRTRLAESFKEACSVSELNRHIHDAIHIIEKEGIIYLDGASWHELKNEMNRASERVASIEFNPAEMSLQSLLALSDEALLAIETLARKKFREKKFQESLSLYAFITSIKENNPTFWLRLGINLQETKDYDRAIRAYEMVIEFDPHNIGAHIFSAECFLSSGNKQEAEKRMTEAFRLINEQLGEDRWNASLAALRKKL